MITTVNVSKISWPRLSFSCVLKMMTIIKMILLKIACNCNMHFFNQEISPTQRFVKKAFHKNRKMFQIWDWIDSILYWFIFQFFCLICKASESITTTLNQIWGYLYLYIITHYVKCFFKWLKKFMARYYQCEISEWTSKNLKHTFVTIKCKIN